MARKRNAVAGSGIRNPKNLTLPAGIMAEIEELSKTSRAHIPWSKEELEVLRLCREKGVDAKQSRDLINRKFGTNRTLDAINNRRTRI